MRNTRIKLLSIDHRGFDTMLKSYDLGRGGKKEKAL